MPEPEIVHHKLSVIIKPPQGALEATDTLLVKNVQKKLECYIGKRFFITAAQQKERELPFKIIEEEAAATGISKKYQIEQINPEHEEITIQWTGKIDKFEGYRVSVIRADLVELSGFCGWFPTIKPSSQMEEFTYELEIKLPNNWPVVIAPGKKEMSRKSGHYRFDYLARTIQDILICASPELVKHSKGKIAYIMPDWSKKKVEHLLNDYCMVVEQCEQLFGEMLPDCGGTAIISPRKNGAEWGFERGNLWIVGENFAKYWLEKDKTVKGLTKSFAAHESIHAWFGVGVKFAEDWLAEAITQYLEVIITSLIYHEKDLPQNYFNWYKERILQAKKQEDRAIANFSIIENTYVYWYCKGSWVFWDLEGTIGRKKILDFFASLFKKYARRKIDYKIFKVEAETFFERDFSSFFDSWFLETGFEPKFR
ncbi:MAG: hypothetical protein GF308_16960 [Candidatus Heimdallarchaeota archaeon]|nr:hypothetical protein [Candidatus Heimdallarchaeota archaeon]